MTVLNLGQVAESLGFKSSASLRRLLKRGLLDEYQRPGPDGRSTYLETEPDGLPTLKQKVQAHTQCHFNSPLWRGDPSAADDWTVRAAAFIDPSCWSAPPWTAQEWRNLRALIELAEDAD